MEEYLVSHDRIFSGYRLLYKFPNGYGASVVNHEYSRGTELAVVEWLDDDHWKFCYTTPITDDIFGYLDTQEEIDNILLQIFELKKPQSIESDDYVSPIQIISKTMASKISEDVDKLIWNRIMEYDIKVDKEKLIDILNRDKSKALIRDGELYKCPNCGVVYVSFLKNFCGDCGQRIFKDRRKK